MNLYPFNRLLSPPAFSKCLLVSKLCLLLIVVSFAQVNGAVAAQGITLNEKNTPLEKLFATIKRQSGYDFFYNAEVLKKARPVTLRVKDAHLEQVLEKCFENQPLQYSITDKTIVVKARESKPQSAPDQEVRGSISDSTGSPLVGVTIQVKGTSRGTSSDIQGRYSLSVPENASLVFSYIGFEETEIKVNGRQQIDIVLTPKASQLSEVVVVGYGTQKKANLTGAVNSVKVDEILGNRPVTTTGALLQGTVPGLQVTIGSGAPGVDKSFNIRGATDIGTSGNEIKTQGPFIVVDNVPFNGPLNLIDPNDIETITVLKDAGSAAIYGARSAFGVILVTTKKGNINQKPKFSYSNNLTISTPMSLPEKATVRQTIQSYQDMGTSGYFSGQNIDTWLELLQKYEANPGDYPKGYAIENGTRYQLATTDALRDVLGQHALQSNHNFSVAGGSEKTTYRLSLGTVKENGIIVPDSKTDWYKRYNLRSFVGTEIKPWLTVQLDAAYYNSNRSVPGADALNPSVVLAPYVTMEDSIEVNGEKVLSGKPRNNVLTKAPTLDRFDDTRLTGRVILKPVKGLVLTGEYTYDNLRNTNTLYNKITTTVDVRQFKVENNGSGSYRKINENTDYKSINVFANYDRAFKKHNFSLLTGYNQEESSFEQYRMERIGIISAEYPSISTATGIPEAMDDYSEFAVLGVFGRLNYDYAGKYLVGLTSRYDASSRFPARHRSGSFPSVSLGWNVMQENFLKQAPSWLNELKPRASYGSVGNQAISPYAFLPTMEAYYATWLHDKSQVTTLRSPGLISTNFTWATVTTLNLGFDLGLLNNRFTANLDWFTRDTKDILYPGIQLPAVLGEQAPLQNVAALRSKGMEIQVNWKDKVGQVNYRLGANLADFRSEITNIKNEAGLLSQYYVGQELGEIWGYTTDRLYTEADFVEGSLSANLTGGTLKPGIPKMEGQLPNPGDVMFVDYDGNGIINAGASTLTNLGDRRIIGNSTARYRYGMNGGLNWKNFDFSFILSGVAKQDQWRANLLTFPNFYAFGTIYSHQLDYWTPANRETFWGRIYDQAGGNQKFNQSLQTKYLLNGAHLRVRNLTLGYTIPANLSKRVLMDRIQAFVSVENAFTFDHLPKGLDPDITRDGVQGYEYPFMRQYSMGVNVSF